MGPDSREAGGLGGLPGGRGEREAVTRPGGEEEVTPFGGDEGLLESGLKRELGEPEFGGLVLELPELLRLLLLLPPPLPLPQLESTDGTLTKADTSEDRVELQASIRCFSIQTCLRQRRHTDNPPHKIVLRSSQSSKHSFQGAYAAKTHFMVSFCGFRGLEYHVSLPGTADKVIP